MNMASELAGSHHVCRYTLIDIRSLDSEPFLQSPWLADNIVAILTNLRHQRETLRQILTRIATLEPGARAAAFAQLFILAGLRKLGKIIETEVKAMPILDSLLDHDLLGPAIRQGMEEGMQREGLLMVRRMLEKRFGALPPAIEQHLAQLAVAELESLSLHLLDATSLEELFNH